MNIRRFILPWVGKFVLSLFILAIPNLTFAWDIQDFHADITIQQDGTLKVTETIVADYTGDPHHGIIRTIPVRYQDNYGNAFSLDFKLESVTDQNGQPWQYAQTFSGKDVDIKIGDPDKLVSGPTTFNLTYTIKGAILFFEDHDELYWNVTGNETDVPTQKASAKVDFDLPAPPPAENELKATCFTGTLGSAEQNCTFLPQDGSITYQTDGNFRAILSPGLSPYEGLTIVAGFPKGFVREPGWDEKLWHILRDNFGYFIPIPVLLLLIYLWYSRGRDPETTKTSIMPIYTPPKDLTPAEIGTIIDERADMKDITATIIDLAVRGYIQIIETKEKKLLLFEHTEYEFRRLNSDNAKSTKSNQGKTPLKSHENALLDDIFHGSDHKKLSDLKQSFYSNIPELEKKIYHATVEGGYFPKNPKSVRNTYLVIATVMIFLGIFGITFALAFLSISYAVGIIISGLICLAFANVMPAKTTKGVKTYYEILGLREYIKTAEKDRIEFQEREKIFEKLLPYAMVFGIGERWTKAFEGIYKQPPDWYRSNDPYFMNNFSTYYFYRRLEDATRNMGSTFQSRPSGSSASHGGSGFSGGFSGGGFGGGGTSSW